MTELYEKEIKILNEFEENMSILNYPFWKAFKNAWLTSNEDKNFSKDESDDSLTTASLTLLSMTIARHIQDFEKICKPEVSSVPIDLIFFNTKRLINNE